MVVVMAENPQSFVSQWMQYTCRQWQMQAQMQARLC
jgi:hypothetical protein